MIRTSLWYQRSWMRWLLWPISLIYQKLSHARKQAYLSGKKPRYRAPVPVVIVGNISVGGTGKTPLVIALVELLRKQGLNPGVVSRGYKAKNLHAPRQVTASSDASEVGDEPLLIFERTGAPVYVFPRRQKAIEAMLSEHKVDIVLCDDGLQHYALCRDIEIAVVDAARLHGNGLCLPAGPLREPVSRLATVDITVYNGQHNSGRYYTSEFTQLMPLVNALAQPSPPTTSNEPIAIDQLGEQSVHAVAGIGHPKRFFDLLRQYGLDVIEHSFKDHHQFHSEDLQFNDSKPIIMTEKDAVKCRSLDVDFSRCWYTVLDVTLSEQLQKDLLARLQLLPKSNPSKPEWES